MTDPSRYAAFPDHVLANVPQKVLDVARKVLAEAAESHDVDVAMADPIADSVVAALVEAGYLDPQVPGEALALALQNERHRWTELRIYAAAANDGALQNAIDAAEKRYAV
jgi:hypothetical protein